MTHDTRSCSARVSTCCPIYAVHVQAYAKGQSEVVMGEAIKELGWKRSDVVLSTKIFWVSTELFAAHFTWIEQ
jgi:hypothetical protein